MTVDSQAASHERANSPAPPSKSAGVDLVSLAPRYESEHHSAYLVRLKKVIADPKNRNIALTGRYGSGKSSVLNEFEKSQKSVLRLAISTLGPGVRAAPSSDQGTDEGSGGTPATVASTLTNQIQKELVKQLVFSAEPSTLRHSRFRGRTTLPWWRAVGEAAGLVAVLAGLLWFFGWLPVVTDPSPAPPPNWRAVGSAVLAVLLVAVLTAVRLVTHDRWVVSDISAGGATLTLSERTPTFFDEYLDDIVYYFDSEDVDLVIFEDLDRFNDPHIFEALRELNTLLNNTDKRLKKGKPLRFVYAVRDSLFEKLGTDTATASDDAAAAETVRANRTKFFDVVIPMVPFISHRNAQDLLQGLLDEAGIGGIERGLVNLVARHAIDMRLLRNIRNEYLVFAEQLLESSRTAPGLTQSNLFGLVAYKNFHLSDFENIARRASDLDVLYNYRRSLVSTTIQQQQQRQRAVIAEGGQVESRAALAERLGARLRATATTAKQVQGYPSYESVFQVGGAAFSPEQLSEYPFWEATAEEGTVHLGWRQSPAHSITRLSSLTRDLLVLLVPEGLEADRWADFDAEAARTEIDTIDGTIAEIRGLDFADLAKTSYTLTVACTSTAEGAGADRTFAKLVDLTMKSDLARDLVKRGYLDRNFALYAAKFYGTFTGVDVANFIVQNAQPNKMEINFDLSRDGAVANLLAETDDDFTRTAAAYNIDIVNYLLRENHVEAGNVIDRLVTLHDDDASTFLAAYLTTSSAERERLMVRLAAQGWEPTFRHLITSPDVPDNYRDALVSAALTGMDERLVPTYDMPQEVGQFIANHYQKMAAFTQQQTVSVTRSIAALLGRASVVLTDLAPVDESLRLLVVDAHGYSLTATNLRVATGTSGAVTLDNVMAHQSVYRYCLAQPGAYLSAVNSDPATDHTATTPQALLQVLSDTEKDWDDSKRAEHLDALVLAASPQAQLASLPEAPLATWTALARAGLFRASLANAEAYRTRPGHDGSIDEPLARLLEDAGILYTEELGDTTNPEGNEYDRETAAVAILNASAISAPATRVQLVNALDVSEVTVSSIKPEPSDLFARLLDHGLVADDAASFTHFHTAGWTAISPAIVASQHILEFLAPSLVDGMVGDLLEDTATPDKVAREIVERAEEFVPTDDPEALRAVANYADQHLIALTPNLVARTAAATEPSVVLRLLGAAAPPATAPEIVSVFTSLGGERGKIASPGSEFTVPNDALHEGLLNTLRAAGSCDFQKKRNQELYVVKVS